MKHHLFLQNIEDIELSADNGKHEVDISVRSNGETTTMVEVYDVQDGVLIVEGLSDMLLPYFDYSDQPVLNHVAKDRGLYASYAHVDVSVAVRDGESYEARAQYSRTRVAPENVSSYVQFLSRLVTGKLSSGDSIACVNFFNLGQRFVVEVSIEYRGNVRVVPITLSTDRFELGQMLTFTFTMMDIVKMIAEADVIVGIYQLLSISLVLYDGEKMIDRLCYKNELDFSKEKSLLFVGSVGEWEVISFRGSLVEAPEDQSEFVSYRGGYHKLRAKFARMITLNTYAMSEGEKMMFYDLMATKWAWMVEGGKLVPMTIVSVEMEDTERRNEALAVTVKMRRTYDKEQITFAR